MKNNLVSILLGNTKCLLLDDV